MVKRVLKWDFIRGKYVEMALDTSAFALGTKKLDNMAKCINCCKSFKIGEMYASLEWHAPNGVGYLVCPSCHNFEIEKEDEYNGRL